VSAASGPQGGFDFREARCFNRPQEMQGEMNLFGPGPANRARGQLAGQTRGGGLQAGDNVGRRKEGNEQAFCFGFGHKRRALSSGVEQRLQVK
jgi:hypothetical protein